MTEEGEVVQVRLISGDELICTVVSHDESAFIVHSLLHMIPYGELDVLEEMESYILRPYVTYTANLEQPISLNPIGVVLISSPSPSIRAQYLVSCSEIQKQLGFGDDGEKLEKEEEAPVGNVISMTSRKQVLTED
jgi:hypothetical protein